MMTLIPATIESDPLLASEKVLADRRNFLLELREDGGQRFLKITENAHGRDFTITLPVRGLPAFFEAMQRLVETERRR